MLLNVAAAEDIIAAHTPASGPHTVALRSPLPGVLAEPVVSDRPQPAFDRAMMDGIAVCHADLSNIPNLTLDIMGTQQPGDAEDQFSYHRGKCIEIMTGAAVPSWADTVIPYESVHCQDGKAHCLADTPTPQLGEFIHGKGTDLPAGAAVLQPGESLSPPRKAIAAALGYHEIALRKDPAIAIVSTGNEIVDIHQQPGPFQIRGSNSVAIEALLAEMGCQQTQLIHIPDDPKSLREQLGQLLQTQDCVILTGGVSKGKFDFVPGIIEELGITRGFHGIAQKPGKPMYFGYNAHPQSSDAAPEDSVLDNSALGNSALDNSALGNSQQPRTQLVFGLPGNPVSALVTFVRYVRPAIQRMMAGTAYRPLPLYARLQSPITFQKAFTYFLPVAVTSQPDGTLAAEPVTIQNSGHFARLGATDGFLELPADKEEFPAGTAYPLHLWRTLS